MCVVSGGYIQQVCVCVCVIYCEIIFQFVINCNLTCSSGLCSKSSCNLRLDSEAIDFTKLRNLKAS